MPRIDDMEEMKVVGPGTFVFSAVKPDRLGASEYTLVTIVCDVSGSVTEFRDDLVKTMRSIIDACKKSERSENLMVRLVTFNANLDEIHGFKELHSIDPSSYDVTPNGFTALFDAVYSSIGATLTYGNTLTEQDFDVNGAIYIITDGMDNSSSMSPKDIKRLTNDAKKGEKIESLITILVGIKDPNDDQLAKSLNMFATEAGLTQFIDMGEATPRKLAHLASFVSKSISSQSSALGSGSPSQPPSITF